MHDDGRPDSVYMTFPWDASHMAQSAALSLALRGYRVSTRLEPPFGSTHQVWEVRGESPVPEATT